MSSLTMGNFHPIVIAFYTSYKYYTLFRELPTDESFADMVYFDKYKIGTNSTYFGPQGGLRISLPEVGNMLMMFGNSGKFKECQVLQPDSVKEMCKAQWTYDEKLQNGETYNDTLLNNFFTFQCSLKRVIHVAQ